MYLIVFVKYFTVVKTKQGNFYKVFFDYKNTDDKSSSKFISPIFYKE